MAYPSYILVDNAIIVPGHYDSQRRWDSRSGVLDQDGSFYPISQTVKSGRSRNGPPPFPDVGQIDFLPGVHIFGGIWFQHFGHMIVESLGRLWSVPECRGLTESVLFTPFSDVTKATPDQKTPDLFNALGIEARITVLKKPVVVERLIVPRQEFGLGENLLMGSERFLEFIKESTKNIPAKGTEKIYISRSKLGLGRGSVFGEKIYEQWLREDGYEVYHPQEHDIFSQISQYKAARKIISIDASPLHLAAYVTHSLQQVAIINRRSTPFAKVMARQLERFGAGNAFSLDHLSADHGPAGRPQGGFTSWGEVKLSDLGEDLYRRGWISSKDIWRDLREDEIMEQKLSVERATGEILQRLEIDRSKVVRFN